MLNRSKSAVVIRVQNAAAAGTSSLAGSTVDCANAESVVFVYGVGTLTATQQTKLKVGHGDASDGSDKSDLKDSGTPVGAFLADTDSNKCLVCEVVRPTKRYLTPTLVRGTANAVVDFGIAILSFAKREPVTPDTTVKATNLLVSPVAGTAN